MRTIFAHQAIAEINSLLFDDWHTESLEPAPKILEFDFKHFTVLKAIDYVSAYKRDVEDLRANSVKAYASLRTTVVEFLQHQKLSQDYKLREVNAAFMRMYFDYLKQVRDVANKTYNGHRASFHAVMAVLIDRDRNLFKGKNPVAAIKMLSTTTRMHAAYTDEQLAQIRAALVKAGEHHLVFFIQVMYYTLARPEEMRFLQVGHIDLEKRRILFRDETAKTGIEQYVGINDAFAAILQERRIMEFPPSCYLFSNNGFHGGWGRKSKPHNPGPSPVGKSFFYKSIAPVIRALGFYKINLPTTRSIASNTRAPSRSTRPPRTSS
nr:tyrosine-type recombinase/integrase [Chryseolinea lacunae]